MATQLRKSDGQLRNGWPCGQLSKKHMLNSVCGIAVNTILIKRSAYVILGTIVFQVLNSDLTGTFSSIFGKKGSSKGQCDFPCDIAST